MAFVVNFVVFVFSFAIYLSISVLRFFRLSALPPSRAVYLGIGLVSSVLAFDCLSLPWLLCPSFYLHKCLDYIPDADYECQELSENSRLNNILAPHTGATVLDMIINKSYQGRGLQE